MKAVAYDRYGTPDVLEFRDVPEPVPADDEVLVRVHATSVNFADWLFLRGSPRVLRLGAGLRRPKAPVLGTDLAGRVEAVGAAVTGLRPGDEVFGSGRGAFAELAVAKATHLVAKPAGLSFEQAAAVPMAGLTALHGLRAADVRAGQRVLVNGAAGGVGTFAVRLAKARGCRVTGVCSAGGGELVRSIGADHVIDYGARDFTREGARYDVILDNVGNHALSDLRRALTPKGTLVLNSGRGGRWLGSAPRIVRALATSLFTGQRLKVFFSAVNAADLAELAALVESGRVVPVVGRTLPLARAADAFAYFGEGHARGKVVVTV
ncbi:NADPH:quinone reductase-like Zn-dependent oxidoreductase [Saccharothrix tamanrassetensis]|uniref:NADPH:quinone reductase-like Zn-dependent oxidoreductase n=1 Tax=Saccharothrix tamanrassetensis TaxID=1051531 RepID=A0A841CLH0_9PSEU|nr:NAD(P)-dependent alcohol dehydrogenase [Saccharothrix tamanrassetensis]MBB5957940.1 NADPH:quinone reductase-like Zn-dependent oxidoreductase [Saccharothrix tamanrassetensis]